MFSLIRDSFLLPSELKSQIATHKSHEISTRDLEMLNLKCVKYVFCAYFFFHLSVRSARNKEDTLRTFFSEFRFSFDVIMFMETWYCSNDKVLRLGRII